MYPLPMNSRLIYFSGLERLYFFESFKQLVKILSQRKNHRIEILICNLYIIDWVNSQRKQSSQHQFVTNRQQLELAVKKRVDKVLGIFSKSHLSYDYKRPEYQPSLSEMTESAIDLLESSRYEIIGY